jgi:hypothetical protein
MSQKKEDFLEEDPEIRSQKFVLLSFLSPENVLEQKDSFFFSEFVKQYEIDYKLKNLETFLVDVVRKTNDFLTKEADRLESLSPDLSGAAVHCRKSRLNMGGILETYHTFVKESDASLKKTKIKDDYESFLFKNQSRLEEEFFAKNEFRTSIRGLKIRGVTGTHGEAVTLSKKLQRSDPIHNIYVGEVGKWLPWDPKPSQVQDQEYAEDQLNTLMKSYKENEEARDKFMTEERKQFLRENKPASNTFVTMEKEQPSKEAGGSSDGWGTMFDGPADLALERKRGSKDVSGNNV